jgi:uncharacterized phage protein (TIGR01671 family)
MSREIKYRAWCLELKKWITHSVTISAEQRIFIMFIDDFRKFHCFPKTQEEVLGKQFTGLKDKNGREIYEGDIITYAERMHEHGDTQQLRGVVTYDDGHAAFGIAGRISDFEVVGNIFEGDKK